MTTNFTKPIIAAFALVALTHCSAKPPANLQRAELDVNNAKQDQALISYAPTVVQEAEESLAKAKKSWDKDRNRDEVDNLVYITGRKLAIAREEARRKRLTQAATNLQDETRIAALDIKASQNATRARLNDLTVASQNVIDENRRLIDQLKSEISSLKTRETERGLELTLGENIMFATGSADLKPGAVQRLRPLIVFLKKQSKRNAMIEGHTDSVGNDAFNRYLSERRAESVRNLLVNQGIDSRRITAHGLGSSMPIASNDTEAGRLQNRRVEIIVEQDPQRKES